jgi:hypothetical protein
VGSLKWTELAFTRFASLVAGRSLLGLPDEDALLGGAVDSLVMLGDVSSKGTVVDAKDCDKAVFKLNVRHDVNERRWERCHQSYPDGYLPIALDR